MRLQLAVLSLRRHVSRTLLAMLGVTVSAAMLLDMVMLATGMRESFASLLGRNGFSIRVSPRGTLPFDSEATVARAGQAVAAIRSVPGVVAVAPVLGATIHALGGTEPVTAFALGIDPAVQGDYELLSGTEPTAPDALVASDALLSATGKRVGDTLDLAVGFDPQLRTYSGRRKLVVSGRAHFLFLSATDRAAAMQIATVQSMGGAARADRASLFMVRTDSGVNPETARAGIERALPRITAMSTVGAVAEAEKRLSYFRQLAFILGAVSLAVGFLLVTTIVTVSVNERIGEIAVMRAIGVSRLHIVQQIVIEGIGLSLTGAAAGLLLGLVTARYLNSILSAFPGLPDAIDFFLFQPSAAFRALGLLVASGIAAGVYPSWRASSLPISATLREEAVG
ncbi:MAG TPA: FtsX-like permease family protein [Gemmatimonadaceae bacterium]|nr:FtsX-like permease family protein [Gemmatimonadaceae bacterium]